MHTHTYIYSSHSHTHLKLRLKKRRVTRICRYDVRVLQEGQSTERSAQRKELLSTEIKGAVQSRTKRRIKKRERERERRTGQNASSPKSRSNISLSHCARSHSASLSLCGWVCMCVCRTSAWSTEREDKQVRWDQQASERARERFGVIEYVSDGCWDATCGHVQHESMTKTPMQPYSNNLPTPPHPLLLFCSCLHKQATSIIISDVCCSSCRSSAAAAAANNRPADKRANPTLSAARERQRQRGSGLMGERPRLFCIALFSYLASFVFSRISSSSSGAV